MTGIEHLPDILNVSNSDLDRTTMIVSENDANEEVWGDLSNSTFSSGIGRRLSVVGGPFDRFIDQIPLMFYPGPVFYLFHFLALLLLSCSVIVSATLIVHLCSSNRTKPRKIIVSAITVSGIPQINRRPYSNPLASSFMTWNVNERLVMYLALVDLSVGLSHMLDHIYILRDQSNPPDHVCSLFAFFFHGFMISQLIVVMYTAVNACSLIVFNKRLHLGRMDWRLIANFLLIPFIISAVGIRLGLLGQSGAWCFIDLRTRAGLIYAKFFSIVQLFIFLVIAGSYGTILVKIRQSTKHTTDTSMDRFRNPTRIMLIFILAYILQYWSYTVYSVWSLIAAPPECMYFLIVIFVNLGGVYNWVAYTFIRRRFTHVAPTKVIN